MAIAKSRPASQFGGPDEPADDARDSAFAFDDLSSCALFSCFAIKISCRRIARCGDAGDREELPFIAKPLGELLYFYSIAVGSGKFEALLECGERLFWLIELEIVVGDVVVEIERAGVESKGFTVGVDGFLVPPEFLVDLAQVVVLDPIVGRHSERRSLRHQGFFVAPCK